jgi:hypothetical protein
LRLADSAENEAMLADVILTPEVFANAKSDLSDVRLFDSIGRSIPFALRYLRAHTAQQSVVANSFNRTEPEEGPYQLTLDLLENDIQHNTIRVITTGDNFRRAIEIDGSEDGMTWRRVADGNLVRFSDGDRKFNIDTFDYPDSRYRFMRVSVTPDPNPVDSDFDKDQFSFEEVSVLREIEVTGERLTTEATVGPRQASRMTGAASSSWIIELGGDNIPCDQIEVDIADKQFVRDIVVQAELPDGPLGQKVFSPIFNSYTSTWQRKPGDRQVPMVASFNEVQTRRLRLVVADYRNAPLTIRSVKFSAPARQVVFQLPGQGQPEIRLFVGNSDADMPNYDFARNLPDQLLPPPSRGQLQSLEPNPMFVPPPKPFLERFPSLIYVVLTLIVIALAVLIASLARKAISLHDTDMRSAASHINSTA